MEQNTELSNDEFKRIYYDDRLRNAVAFAHQHFANYRLLNYVAIYYPYRYIVTEDQIIEAKALLERAKLKMLKDHENDLLFCCMGWDYEARYEDDVCNHRIRTEFLNKDGHRFFIELGTGGGDLMRIDCAIDRDKEIEQESIKEMLYQEIKKCSKKDPKYPDIRYRIFEMNKSAGYSNYAGLERLKEPIRYTRQNVLNLVNEKFGCNFKSIIIDQHTIHPDDSEIICKSPVNRISERKSEVVQLSFF